MRIGAATLERRLRDRLKQDAAAEMCGFTPEEREAWRSHCRELTEWLDAGAPTGPRRDE